MRQRIWKAWKGAAMAERVVSPCIGVCTLDPVSKLCTGCLRTGDEIMAWPSADDARRLAILARLKERRIAAGRVSAMDVKPRRRRRAEGSADRSGERST